MNRWTIRRRNNVGLRMQAFAYYESRDVRFKGTPRHLATMKPKSAIAADWSTTGGPNGRTK
ncbi:MAG: hypothetical protein HYT88_03115 [Candidatus Omnitrophica bacterium]|nr:hypothetical protein [Candidatus Omnitrophota bacterium]